MNSIIRIINEEIDKSFYETVKYFTEEDEDRITITAIYEENKIGSVTSEILFGGYSYEFDDVFTEDEFDNMFPDDYIVKLEHIEVNDNFKGTGIGTQLIDKMMKMMRSSGYSQFYLNASPMGFSGLRLNGLTDLYKKFGFKEIKHQGHNVLMGISNTI